MSTITQSKVTLTEEKATLLITLHAKAEEGRMPDSHLRDHFAANVIRQIDYDFDKIKVNRDTAIGLALRAKVLDDWVSDFISKNPGATVLNMGCGLDSRVFRVNPPKGINWFDVDYPEVIELRSKFYPARDQGYTMIGTSVTEPQWLNQLPAEAPVMVIAEGLLYYLDHGEVNELLHRILNHFPGGELTFDVYSKLGMKFVNVNAAIRHTGAVLSWSMENGRELEREIPQLKLIDEFVASDSSHGARMSLPFRLVLSTVGKLPAFKKLVQLYRYSF